MRRKSNFVVSALLACSFVCGCYTPEVHADSFADGLKKHLLTESRVPDFNSYNTNNDGTVDVLDLCRKKRQILYADQIQGEPVKISFDYPSIDYSGSKVSFPVRFTNSSYNISAVQLSFEYDSSRFRISGVRPGDAGGKCSFSADNGTVQMMFDKNADTRKSGVLMYIDYTPVTNVQSGVYKFTLKEVQISGGNSYQQSHSFTEKEYSISNNQIYAYFNGFTVEKPPAAVTTAKTPATTAVTAAPVTSTKVPVTVTVPVTTTKPVTTKVTTTPKPVTTKVTTAPKPVTTKATTTPKPVTTKVTTTPKPVTTKATTTPKPVTTRVTTTTPKPVTTKRVVTTRARLPVSFEASAFGEKINQLRTQNNLSKLDVHDTICKVCDDRARMLAQSFSYNTPDGRTVQKFLDDNRIFPTSMTYYISKAASVDDLYNEFVGSAKNYILSRDYFFDALGLGHYSENGQNYWFVLLAGGYFP